MRLVLILCLVCIALLVCIIAILSLKTDERPHFKETPRRTISVNDRMNEHYYNLRTTIHFPKSGRSVPADVAVLAKDPAEAATLLPGVRNMPASSHLLPDDTLNVPYGTQCNLSVEQTQFFLNAGSQLVIGAGNDTATTVALTGEAYVRTAAKGCTVSGGAWAIEVQPDSRVNITAYDKEPLIRICLGAGTASVQQQEDVQVLHKADDAVVIDKATAVMEPRQERFADVTAWTQGKLHGENQPFATIYRQLSRLFDVPIVYPDTALLHGVYSIPYRDFTLQFILGTLEKAQHCHTVVAHDSIFITRDHAL